MDKKEELQKKADELAKWINSAGSMIFFGGAGVSTESGIPDFRSADGLYSEKGVVPPEKILSHTYFKMHPKEFFEFYRTKMIYKDAKPSVTHKTLARLEREGKCRAVITQNIDGLHQMAGSKNVLELHGSVYRNHCIKCGRPYSLESVFPDLVCKNNDEADNGENKNEDIIKAEKIVEGSVRTGTGRFEGVPVCECSGIIKPDVVLYEESLDESVLKESVALIGKCDLLIVGGTSLNVYPAAGLLQYFKGSHLVVINKEATAFDDNADMVIHGALGDVFSKI